MFTEDLVAARDAAFQLGETLGCGALSDNAEQLMECLKLVSAADLLEASNGVCGIWGKRELKGIVCDFFHLHT